MSPPRNSNSTAVPPATRARQTASTGFAFRIFDSVAVFSILACLTGMGRPALCADTDGRPVLTLRQAAQVDGAGVLLQQLVEGDETVSTNLFVAAAPALSQTLVLSRAQIAEAARKLQPGLELTNWAGAEKIRISRRVRSLDEDELKTMLTATLQKEQARERGELELRPTRPWTTVPVPDEPLSLKILDLPTLGLTPNFIVRFEVRAGKETFGPWQMPLQARLWRDLWVARTPQPRGRLLRDADLGTERRDVLTLRDALVSPDFTDGSLELAENLSAGAPLVLHSVRQRPVIRRGKVLDAVVEDGPLLISVKVEALEDGLPGQFIRVRNAKTKIEFQAKVQNEQTVTVTL
jgi:flagella basal body P-ring formation protein FlgA